MCMYMAELKLFLALHLGDQWEENILVDRLVYSSWGFDPVNFIFPTNQRVGYEM